MTHKKQKKNQFIKWKGKKIVWLQHKKKREQATRFFFLFNPFDLKSLITYKKMIVIVCIQLSGEINELKKGQ